MRALRALLCAAPLVLSLAVGCEDDEGPRTPLAPSPTAGTSGSAGGGGSGGTGVRPIPHAPGVGSGDRDEDGGTQPTDAATSSPDASAPEPPHELRLPPPNAGLDYQLGGAYPPPDGVQIVSRDRTEMPVRGLYNICYVNGFQIQPGEESFWLEDHPDLVLRDGAGEPIVDADWDEMLIDVSTDEKRARVAEIIAEWIDGCADAGFDAVEIDNLDSYTRSTDLLGEEDAVDAMALFAEAAHARGLAIAQKNAAELVPRRAELGTDFAVAEECNRFVECGDYTDGYDDAVLIIEYRRADFDDGCAAYPELSIVLRDVDLTTPRSAAYVYDGC